MLDQLPAVDLGARPDHGVWQFTSMRMPQVQAFHQSGFVQLYAFEICFYRFLVVQRRDINARVEPLDAHALQSQSIVNRQSVFRV